MSIVSGIRARGTLLALGIVPLTLAATANHAAAAKTLPLPQGHRVTEASVAIDPAHPRDVLVVARDENGGRHVGLRMWRSRNGGRTFTGSMLVDYRLAGLPADASDPVALFDSRGRPAPSYLAIRYGPSWWESRIMLGGRIAVRARYGLPYPSFDEGFGTHTWFDKPWATTDRRSGRAYVTWTEQSSTTAGPISKVAIATAAAKGRFGRPHVLGTGSGSQPVIGTHNVIVVWYQQPNLSQYARILSARSSDRGRTWSRPVVIARHVNSRGDPPLPTVVPAGGGYAACWQEYTVWPHERIACSHTDNAHRWSRARIVAQPAHAGDAAQPALAHAPGGRLWLAFYRFDRHSTSVELWRSNNRGAAWGRRAVLMRSAVPRSGTGFLGDYQGLAASASRVIAAFVMPVRPMAFRQVVRVASVPAR